jgi:hypothetical protein
VITEIRSRPSRQVSAQLWKDEPDCHVRVPIHLPDERWGLNERDYCTEDADENEQSGNAVAFRHPHGGARYAPDAW